MIVDRSLVALHLAPAAGLPTRRGDDRVSLARSLATRTIRNCTRSIGTRAYSLNMRYDRIGNVRRMTQNDIMSPAGGSPYAVTDTTRDALYQYNGTPHAASQVGGTFHWYDANGNQAYSMAELSSRTGGQRVAKLGSSTMRYPSAFVTVNNGSTVTHLRVRGRPEADGRVSAHSRSKWPGSRSLVVVEHAPTRKLLWENRSTLVGVLLLAAMLLILGRAWCGFESAVDRWCSIAAHSWNDRPIEALRDAVHTEVDRYPLRVVRDVREPCAIIVSLRYAHRHSRVRLDSSGIIAAVDISQSNIESFSFALPGRTFLVRSGQAEQAQSAR